jgi:hypothetical protein
MENKKNVLTVGAIILASVFVAQSSFAQGNGSQMGAGAQGQGQNIVDNNGNGIADGLEDDDNDGILNRDDSDYVKSYVNMQDTDADGIANKIDTDYAPAADGTGRQVMTQGQQGEMVNGSGSGMENSEAGQGVGQGAPQNQENSAQAMNRINNHYNNPALGERVMAMNQEQVQNQNLIQEKLQIVSKRSGVAKFFAGPDYVALGDAENRLSQHEERISQLQTMSQQVVDPADKILLEEQIATMTQISTQLRTAINENEQGFSLFGWAFKLFN